MGPSVPHRADRAGLRSLATKRPGPPRFVCRAAYTFSRLWNLCSARRLSRGAAELGNQQSRRRPHGVMPGAAFLCASAARQAGEPCDGDDHLAHEQPVDPGLTSGLPGVAGLSPDCGRIAGLNRVGTGAYSSDVRAATNFRAAEKSRIWLGGRYSMARWRNGSSQGFHYRA